ncbi:hypothetical protein ACS0TY_011690 [Phlomoides rotata]
MTRFVAGRRSPKQVRVISPEPNIRRVIPAGIGFCATAITITPAPLRIPPPTPSPPFSSSDAQPTAVAASLRLLWSDQPPHPDAPPPATAPRLQPPPARRRYRRRCLPVIRTPTEATTLVDHRQINSGFFLPPEFAINCPQVFPEFQFQVLCGTEMNLSLCISCADVMFWLGKHLKD